MLALYGARVNRRGGRRYVAICSKSSRSKFSTSITCGKSAHAPRRSDVSVFDQTDPTRVAIVDLICPSPGTCRTTPQFQQAAPVQDIRSGCGRLCFLPFALIRRPPAKDIPTAVCQVAFAHVTTLEIHCRVGSGNLVERCP